MVSRRGALIMYQLIADDNGNTDAILRIADVACIPMDEGNKDYRAYLAWVAEGNTPLPASEG